MSTEMNMQIKTKCELPYFHVRKKVSENMLSLRLGTNLKYLFTTH